jgi:hypothetical protein
MGWSWIYFSTNNFRPLPTSMQTFLKTLPNLKTTCKHFRRENFKVKSKEFSINVARLTINESLIKANICFWFVHILLFFTNYAAIGELRDRMRFEAECAKSHHRVISEALSITNLGMVFHVVRLIFLDSLIFWFMQIRDTSLCIWSMILIIFFLLFICIFVINWICVNKLKLKLCMTNHICRPYNYLPV